MTRRSESYAERDRIETPKDSVLDAGHLGLATLRELALSVGETLHIISRQGQGTAVKVSVPYAQPVTQMVSERNHSREESESLT